MGIDVRAYAMANQDGEARLLRGLRHVRPRLPARRAQLENEPVRWKVGQPIRVYAVDL